MKIVNQILQAKGGEVFSVSAGSTVLQALQIMAEKNVGALVVLDGKKMVGIVSERDYARKVALKGKKSALTTVNEIMTPDVISVTPDESMEACMARMTGSHIRHLPVLEAGDLVGVISIGDVVKALITDKEFTIEQLEKYIRGEV
jgi:CBS domain-containing protein